MGIMNERTTIQRSIQKTHQNQCYFVSLRLGQNLPCRPVRQLDFSVKAFPEFACRYERGVGRIAEIQG
jgi:hypothetical protein